MVVGQFESLPRIINSSERRACAVEVAKARILYAGKEIVREDGRMPLCNLKEANVFWFAPESELPILEHPARQPFANAAIAASRVTALPCVGVRCVAHFQLASQHSIARALRISSFARS